MMTREILKTLIKDTRSDLATMRLRVNEYDSEAVGEIAKDIESRMGGIVAAMEIEGIAVAVQAGHNGGDSPILDV